MSDPLLPGIRVGSGRDLNEKPVVIANVWIADEADPLTLVLPPQEAAIVGRWCNRQEDRRVRAFGALLLRQADLLRNAPHLRVVG